MVLVTSVRGVRWVPVTDTEEVEEEEVEEALLDWGGWMSCRTSAGVVELRVHRSPISMSNKCLRRVDYHAVWQFSIITWVSDHGHVRQRVAVIVHHGTPDEQIRVRLERIGVEQTGPAILGFSGVSLTNHDEAD